jgi:hypothetical protein
MTPARLLLCIFDFLLQAENKNKKWNKALRDTHYWTVQLSALSARMRNSESILRLEPA